MLDKQSVITYYEQLPPQHNLAEEVLLGGILLDSNIIEAVIGELSVESFALERHQLIYRTIVDIYVKKKYIDSIILINTLWELNLLNRIGGISKILQLLQQAQVFTSKLITHITIKYYIHLIQDKYIRRQLIQYGYNIINLAHNSSIDSATIFFKLDRYMSHIKSQLIYRQSTNINSLITQLFLNLKSPQTQNQTNGLLSHFRSLDILTGGFKDGDLVVIAGRPSMGKTSFSLNIALNIIKKESKGVIFFSLEMSKYQILYKLLSINSNIPTNSIRTGQIKHQEWEQLQQAGKFLTEASINIDDSANMSIMQIDLKAKGLLNKSLNMNLLIIDYLQLIQLPHNSFNNRSEELSQITRSLKVLAKDLNIPIIVLSQLNRNVESRINKKPLLSDLRESGCIGLNTSIIKDINYQYLSNYYTIQYKNSYLKKIDHLLNLKKKEKYFLKYNEKQYLYHIINKSQKDSIKLTHNHLLLTRRGWKRIDNLKSFSQLIQVLYNNITFVLYTSIKKVYLFTKNHVYDLIANDEKMFFANKYSITHNSIEQDADLVLLLYRESYYNHNFSTNDLTDLIIAKHRNGPTGTAQLYFRPEISTFTSQ